MEKKSFQNYVINSITSILNNCIDKNVPTEVFESEGSRKTIKNGFIAHYASIYYDTISEGFANFWQSSNIRHCRNILMSQKAYDIYDSIRGNALYKSRKEKNGIDKYSYAKYKTTHTNPCELLYWEHISPNGSVWEEIKKLYSDGLKNNSKIISTDVKKCFSEHSLLLITQEEAAKLDANGSRDGQKAINEYRALSLHSVAAYRIKMLFDDVKIGSLYLYDKEKEHCLQEPFLQFTSFNEIYDGNGFIGKVKDYFENNDFTI